MTETGVNTSEKIEGCSFDDVKAILSPLSLSERELSDLENTLKNASFRDDFYKSLILLEQRGEWSTEYSQDIANGIKGILTSNHDQYRYLDNIIREWNEGKGPQNKISFKDVVTRFRFLEVQLQNLLHAVLDRAYERSHPNQWRRIERTVSRLLYWVLGGTRSGT